MRVLFIVVLLCGCLVAARGQGSEATIKNVTSQTADLLTFRISVPQRLYGPGQNIVVSYTVRNDSAKMAYLVTEPEIRLDVDKKNRTLRIESPVKYQQEFNRYDNDFIRLRPGQSHAGQLVIDGKQIPINPKSESEDWTLDARFAYVFNLPGADMEELLQCVGTRYSLPCLGKLEDVAQVLTVGTLIVGVKSR